MHQHAHIRLAAFADVADFSVAHAGLPKPEYIALAVGQFRHNGRNMLVEVLLFGGLRGVGFMADKSDAAGFE